MRTSCSQTSLFLTSVIVFLGTLLFQAPPVTAAATQSTGVVSGCGSNNNHGCSYWWDWSLVGNTIPGQTLYFTFNLYNTDPSADVIMLNSFTVQTPWANYTDASLPQAIDTGYSYSNGIAITIPQDQIPGSVVGNIRFTGQFFGGSYWCSDTGDVCSDTANFTIIENPAVLQSQISSLETQVAGYNTQISSLQSKIASLNNTVTTLTAQLNLAKENLTTDGQTISGDQAGLNEAQDNLSMAKQTIAADQAALSQAQNDLSTAKSSLTSDQAQLASEEAELASSQSSLNSATGIYLPIAAGIPSVVAVVFALLYFKKKPVASSVH